MSPEQKALVKETWQKAAPTADAVARLFYDRLFEIDAATRSLFKKTDLTEQRRKLIQASRALQFLLFRFRPARLQREGAAARKHQRGLGD